MAVWMMVLFLDGTGKAMVVLPFEYETAEACVAAARAMEPSWDAPAWICVSGPSPHKEVEDDPGAP